MNIPPRFDAPSELSDVVLIATDVDGKERELHTTKMYLSMFSSFFKTMFFSGFAEANSRSVKVSCSYEIMLLILHIIHGQSQDFSTANKIYKTEMLMELYKAADYLDIPAIRKICVQQMASRPSVRMATAVFQLLADGLDLRATLTEIFVNRRPSEVKRFISIDNSSLLFSKKDVKFIYGLIAGKQLPLMSNEEFWSFSKFQWLDLSREVNGQLLIDVTQKWPRSHVLIKTNESEGKDLFSNKTILATVSPVFDKMFFGQSDSDDLSEIHLDVDYLVMKNILTIIHHCYNKGSIESITNYQLFMNYLMYCAAAEDRLDIPKIRELCIRGMHETIARRMANARHLDMAIKMNLPSVKHAILKNMKPSWLHIWLNRSALERETLYFTRNNMCNVLFTTKEETILSLNDVRLIVEKLLKEFNK